MTEMPKEGIPMLLAAYPDKKAVVDHPTEDEQRVARWLGRLLEIWQNDDEKLVYKLTDKGKHTASWYAGDRK